MKLPNFSVFHGQNKPEEDFDPFPDLSTTPPSKKIKTEYIIFSASLLVFLGSLGFYLIFKNNQSKLDLSSNTDQQVQAAPTPTPKPLPSGKQIYHFSHGSEVVGPKPTTAIIDPIDPSLGDIQTFSVSIEHATPVSKATAILKTDNQEEEISLTLTAGDENKGTWTAEWQMNDSYNYTYQIDIIIHDTTELFSGGLAFR